jgi:hypothetical protein
MLYTIVRNLHNCLIFERKSNYNFLPFLPFGHSPVFFLSNTIQVVYFTNICLMMIQLHQNM